MVQPFNNIFLLLKVFVGGLDPEVSEDDLKEAFSQYGEITSVKIPVGKQCGFVLFAHRYILLIYVSEHCKQMTRQVC